MEVVNTYGGIRETVFGNGHEPSVHVTTEEPDIASHINAVCVEIFGKIRGIDFLKNIKDTTGIPIGDIAVIAVNVPARMGGIPFTGRTFEFIDTQCLWEPVKSRKFNGCENRRYDRFSGAGIDSNIAQRTCSHKPFTYRHKGGLRKVEAGAHGM